MCDKSSSRPILNWLQAAQTELGKAAQDFRRLHEERQELLAQWEGVLKAISKRDGAILEAGEGCGPPQVQAAPALQQ